MDTNKIREALDLGIRLVDKIRAAALPGPIGPDVLGAIHTYERACNDALAELDKAQQPAEPVAWMWRQLMHGYMGGWHFKCETYNPLNNIHVKPEDIEALTPLYTHPPQAQQPAEPVAWDVVNANGNPVDTSTYRTRDAAYARATQCNEGQYTTGKPFAVIPLYTHQ